MLVSSLLIIFLTSRTISAKNGLTLRVEPQDLSMVLGEDRTVQFRTSDSLAADVEITLKRSTYFDGTPNNFLITTTTRTADVIVTANKITSYAVLEIEKCNYVNGTLCPFTNLDFVFTEIKVVQSKGISIAVIVVGWIYFVAWSISFYPQIFLNCRRQSVVGLNFDFLLLNIIGFACYTFYNVLMYFDKDIQEIYEKKHPHSLIPVLLNDVVFAAHALLACLVTAAQCFFYKRGNQRISYTCLGLSSCFLLIILITVILLFSNVINALQFIMSLAYIKMFVTLCKYFPQAFLNYRRHSTVGWSIGNVLLDFLGGSMDIFQMILQSANTNDWSVFYGNPVKFGLGLVSMIFDVIFITQHYCLYPNKDSVSLNATNEEENADENARIETQVLPVVLQVGANNVEA